MGNISSMLVGFLQYFAALGFKWADFIIIMFFTVFMTLFSVSLAFPLATQEDVAAAIAKVADLEETEFAAEPRDAKAFVSEAIDAVRDLEETEFAAEPRDAKASVEGSIEKVRDLEPTDFSKVFD